MAEICNQMDGILLVIELAARIGNLSAEELAQRLNERFSLLRIASSSTQPNRQQTLENVIKWSYDLLPKAEQILWERLFVSVGGSTRGG